MTASVVDSSPCIGDYVAPQGWGVVPLGQLFSIQQGKALSVAARTAPTRYPFLRTANVLWGKLELETVDEMGLSDAERSKLLLAKGDLLVCEGGEIGRAAIWDGSIEDCYFQNHIHRLRPLAEGVEPSFYVYWLQLAFTRLGVYEGAGTKTTIANLSRGRLSNLLVPVPPLEEQRRIARILATINRARDTRLAVALAARRLKSSLQESFFDSADPACLVEVGRLGRVVTGRTPSTTVEDYYGGDIPFIGPGDIDNDTEVIRAAKTLSELGLTKASAIPRGAVLTVCIGATIGKVGRTGTERAATNQQINSLIVEGDVIDSRYVHRAIEYFAQELPNHASRAAIPIVNKSNFERLQIPVPSRADQLQTARALDAVAEYREATLKEATALDQLFGAAMHLLMEQSA